MVARWHDGLPVIYILYTWKCTSQVLLQAHRMIDAERLQPTSITAWLACILYPRKCTCQPSSCAFTAVLESSSPYFCCHCPLVCRSWRCTSQVPSSCAVGPTAYRVTSWAASTCLWRATPTASSSCPSKA